MMHVLDSTLMVRIARLLTSVTVVTIVLTAGIATANGFNLRAVDFLLFFMACAAVGGLIVNYHPRHPVGWSLSIGAACFALSEFSSQYAIYGILTNPGSLPAANAVVWPQTWLWAPASALIIVLMPLYFPNGRLISERWRVAVQLSISAVVVASIAGAISPGDTLVQTVVEEGAIVNPLGFETVEPIYAPMDLIVPLVGFALLCTAAASLFLRFRRSFGVERQQIKWVAVAIAGLPFYIVLSNIFEPLSVLSGIFLVSIPAAIGIAILRYDLYDIDLIINRALVYGLLTALVIGAYVLLVGFVGSQMLDEDNLLLSVIATGVVAVLFQPVRDRLQRGVNRLMYGERDEPYAVISRLGRRIEDTLTPDAVLPAIVETVAQALKVPYAAITLGDQSPSTVAAVGTPVGTPVHLPLVYRNEPVGELILAPRRPGESFSAADHRLLDDLTRQAGIAAHAVRLSTELQHSRERLVTAREEERRRLRRDLHDGLGPALASMTLQAEAARDLMAANPDHADELLADLTSGLQEATADIRRLVYGLRPPALDDLGLLPALRAWAARSGPQGPAIEIIAVEPFPPLPAAVEVAAFRIIQEALTNVLHHAAATHCTVNIRKQRDTLHIDITDNGVGLPGSWGSGVGLRSMRERAEELGGTCDIRGLPGGGAQVAAMLPLVLEGQQP